LGAEHDIAATADNTFRRGLNWRANSAKKAAFFARRWNFAELFGELFTSAFAGVITALLCQYAQMSLTLTAALCGIAGHMGGRAIFHLEHFFEARFPSGGSGPQKPLL
jgi:hypothetical protein